MVDDACFNSIPILSAVISLYKIGKTINEAFHIKKLARFLLSLQNGIKNKKTEKYKRKILDDEVFAQKQLDYLLIILERYLQEEKADILSKFFLAYLDEEITWNKFLSFSMSLDFLTMDDIKLIGLFSISTYENGGENSSSIARLVANGLFIEKIPEARFAEENSSLIIKQNKFREYILTNDGYIFNECLKKH